MNDSHGALLATLEKIGLPFTQLDFTAATGLTGPGDEALSSEYFRIGNPYAKNVVLISTGLHGAEAETPDAIVASLLPHHQAIASWLGPDIALVFAVNLNPWGRAYEFRFDHHFRDPNRVNILPTEAGQSQYYDEVDPFLNPPEQLRLGNGSLHALRLLAYRYGQGTKGFKKVADIINRGQSNDPEKMMYTGNGHDCCWSSLVLKRLIRTELREATTVFHLDLHTALGWNFLVVGPTLISIESLDSPGLCLATKLLGHPIRSTKDPENGLSHSDTGTIEQLFLRGLRADQRYLGVCYEAGTWPISYVIAAMWLRFHVLKWRTQDPEYYERNDAWTRRAVQASFSPRSKLWHNAFKKRVYLDLRRVVRGIHDGALEHV